MDLLLTHGYFLSDDPKERSVMKPYAPLGILYMSSHLKRKGFEVEVYDTTFGSRADLYRMLRTGPPSVVGIYANLMTRVSVLGIIRAAREAGWTVVLGGPEPASYAENYLDAGAHLIVVGEGEITMEEILLALQRKDSSFDRIPGLVFRRENGEVVRTPPRALIPDLDAQPWPDREQIDIAEYIRAWRDFHGQGSLSVITARGCPYHCRWCSHSTYGNTHRRRSPAAVADEVEHLIGRYHPDMLWIADDVFTIHRGWVMRYAQELKRRHIRIGFECITRADRIDPEIADVLADLNCFRVWIGSESGSQRILDAMQRGVRVEQVREAVRLCSTRGIQTGMFLMWGYEGEEISDIEDTIDHVKETLPDVFLTTISYPIRGTPYYDEVAGRLASPKAWGESSDRDLVIQGRRSGEFYAYADRLLRGEVALRKLSRIPEDERDPRSAEGLLREIQHARRELHSFARRAGS